MIVTQKTKLSDGKECFLRFEDSVSAVSVNEKEEKLKIVEVM